MSLPRNQSPDNRDNNSANFDERLEKLKQSLDTSLAEKNYRQDKNTTGWAQGLRLGGEFVSGVLVGTGIGYFVDKVFDTKPFGFIIFFLLGFAAGILNLIRVLDVKSEVHNEDNNCK